MNLWSPVVICSWNSVQKSICAGALSRSPLRELTAPLGPLANGGGVQCPSPRLSWPFAPHYLMPPQHKAWWRHCMQGRTGRNEGSVITNNLRWFAPVLRERVKWLHHRCLQFCCVTWCYKTSVRWLRTATFVSYVECQLCMISWMDQNVSQFSAAAARRSLSVISSLLTHVLGVSGEVSWGESRLRCSEAAATCHDDGDGKDSVERCGSWKTPAKENSPATKGSNIC